jgi:serine phosphatase RsbU (regulator of sigma subunit)
VFGRLDLTAQRVEIRPGERLVLYTDGITDAQAPDGSRFGDARLLATIAATCRTDGTAGETVTSVIGSVLGFQGSASPADDLALLVFRRLPGSHGLRSRPLQGAKGTFGGDPPT